MRKREEGSAQRRGVRLQERDKNRGRTDREGEDR